MTRWKVVTRNATFKTGRMETINNLEQMREESSTVEQNQKTCELGYIVLTYGALEGEDEDRKWLEEWLRNCLYLSFPQRDNICQLSVVHSLISIALSPEIFFFQDKSQDLYTNV